MSHAEGAVRFNDGRIMCYEYNGTVDVPISHLYDTMKEVHDNWRNGEWMTCECGKHEKVVLWTNYGYGSNWEGYACRDCRAVWDDSKCDNYDEINWERGDPAWVKDIVRE